MAWAPWALPATNPTVMNSQVKTYVATRISARATSTEGTSAWVRKPTATPRAIVTSMLHEISAVSASERPTITAERGIGSERKRSYTPEAASSATPAGAFIPVHRIVVTRNPGTRKST